MRMDKDALWLLKEKYHGNESPVYFFDLQRLEKGEPLAYVIGWVDFLGCRIDLREKPLIPRVETEWWMEQTIAEIQKARSDTKLHILDLFSGSGCIGIALLKHLPHAHVDFGEQDSKLCTQIEINLEQNHIDTTRTKVIQTNVFSHIEGSYNFIFANPPYIDPALRDTVQPSVLMHEPHDALFAPQEGLYYIEKLLKEGKNYLKNEETLYIELGDTQKDAIEKLAQQFGWNAQLYQDQFKKWRYAKLTSKT